MFELREHGWMWKVTPSGKRFQVSEFRHKSIYLFGSLTFFQISKRTNQIHIIPSRTACVTLSFKTNAVTESELLPDSSTFLLASLRSLIEMQKKKKKHSADFRREGPLTPACVPPFLTPNLHCYRYQSCNLPFFGDRLFFFQCQQDLLHELTTAESGSATRLESMLAMPSPVARWRTWLFGGILSFQPSRAIFFQPLARSLKITSEVGGSWGKGKKKKKKTPCQLL